MRLSLIAVGDRMPDWVEAGCQEYRKRLQNAFTLKLVELPLARRGKSTDLARVRQEETRALFAAVPAGDRIVALDLQGQHWSTEELSRKITRWQMDGANVSFLVGGPDGFDGPALQQAHERWSLSALTLPHPLVRILWHEQMYRAWSILQNHPYHR